MNKKHFSKILICIALIVSAFCLTACSTVNATTVTNEDGTIDELVYVKIDDADLLNQNYTNSQIVVLKNDIKDTASNAGQNIVSNFNVRVQTDALLATTELERQRILSYNNGIIYLMDSQDDGTMIFGLRFRDANVYRYYYNISETASPQYITEKHFLYTKCYYYGLTMYPDYTSLYNQIKSSLQVKYPDLVANNMANLQYTYQTELRREHSDADFVSYKNGVYYHTWIVDENDFEKPIMIYYNIANSGNCILLCIGVSIVLCGILWIVAVLVDKHKKRSLKDN